MGLILFILFFGIPLLEIFVFIQIGGLIGPIPTLLGCVVTAVIGAFLVRMQGFHVLRDAQARLSRDELPVDALAHGAMILVAGVLLMAPGYVTDAMGFALLAPPVRVIVAKWVVNYVRTHAKVHLMGAGFEQQSERAASGGFTIEGEAVEIDDRDLR
ncbi:MAG: FxsA family protein [Parvularculaceae bacterium]